MVSYYLFSVVSQKHSRQGREKHFLLRGNIYLKHVFWCRLPFDKAYSFSYVSCKHNSELEELEHHKAGAGSKFPCRQKIFTYTSNWKLYKYVTVTKLPKTDREQCSWSNLNGESNSITLTGAQVVSETMSVAILPEFSNIKITILWQLEL